MKTHHAVRLVSIATAAVSLAACSSGNSSATGSISVSLMDRPVDGIAELNITVSEIWVKPQGDGPAFQLDMVETPVTVNLLELSVDEPAIFVNQANIPAATYNWIEMRVDDSSLSSANAVTTDGIMKRVDVPSDRVRLINSFDVEANNSVRFLFDWNVRKGLTEAVGRDTYILKPVIRVLDVLEFRSVVGEITEDTIMAMINDCNADSPVAMDYSIGNVIYVFEEGDDPGEIGVIETLTTVDAEDNDLDGAYEYNIALMPGTYTFTATCQGGLDTDDDDGLELSTFFLEPLAGDSVVVIEAAGDVAGPSF